MAGLFTVENIAAWGTGSMPAQLIEKLDLQLKKRLAYTFCGTYFFLSLEKVFRKTSAFLSVKKT